jgi:hypothetical protein
MWIGELGTLEGAASETTTASAGASAPAGATTAPAGASAAAPAGAEAPASPAERMIQFLGGFWIARAIHAAAKLRIADHLAQEPKTVEQLAALTETHAPSLYRLLRALVGAEVFREETPGVFALTPLGETLRSDVRGSLRSTFHTCAGDDHYDAWGQITHAVKTGQTAFDHVVGMPIWKFYERNEENGRNFNQFMTDFTTVVDEAIVEAYDFGGFEHLVDVGGGHGQLLRAVLRKHPHLRGTVFDQPGVVEGTQKAIAAANLEGRCRAVGGDFFESIPVCGDAYMMKFIIHDWDDARSIRILSNTRKALSPIAGRRGRLLIIETVIPEDSSPHFSKLMDLNMLVMTGGRERTEREYAELLRAGGWWLKRVIPTESAFSIVEAEPA